MLNDYISLYEVTPEAGGIFSALDSFAVPWKDDIDPDLLDLQYYGNVSGEKTISPLVYKNLDDSGKLSESKQTLIASMIFKLYGANWIKEWATLSKQYDPIANYDMTEIMEDDETVIEYGKTEDTTTGNTHTKTGTETDTPDVTITTDDSIYGFNSSSASHSNKRVEDPNGTNETEYDLSETDNGSVGLEQGGSDTHTRNYTLTRKGNIGVTTSQQLLQAERDLWMWNYFNDVVFPDVDRVLTIPLYAESTGYSGESGSVTPTGTIYITENGNRIDVSAFAYANVNVPNSYSAADEGKVVSDGDLVAQTGRTITENDTYDTTENNQVIVNVPNTYSAADEGKVVSNGGLVVQTSRIITENGVYDTTENNQVEVDVDGNTILSGQTEPISSEGENGNLYLLYTNHTPINYVKFTISKIRSYGGMQLSEIGFKYQYQDVVLPQGTTIQSNAAAYTSTQTVDKIIDGNLNTKYYTEVTPTVDNPINIILSFPNEIFIDLFEWYTAEDSSNRDPVSFTLSISSDGITYNPVLSVSDGSITTNRKALAYSGIFHNGIYKAYVKKSGNWQPLMGSGINDIN